MTRLRKSHIIRALVVGLALGWMAVGAAQDYQQVARSGKAALVGG